jgi:HK97 gp10 family phage protein
MPAIVGGMFKLMQQLDAVGLEFTAEDLVPGAQVILEYAQDLCPVDTGFLRDSGHLVPEESDVSIVFDAEYASYVEFGTSRMEAQPFLRPALDEAQDEALSAIVDSVQSHMIDITQ